MKITKNIRLLTKYNEYISDFFYTGKLIQNWYFSHQEVYLEFKKPLII